MQDLGVPEPLPDSKPLRCCPMPSFPPVEKSRVGHRYLLALPDISSFAESIPDLYPIRSKKANLPDSREVVIPH